MLEKETGVPPKLQDRVSRIERQQAVLVGRVATVEAALGSLQASMDKLLAQQHRDMERVVTSLENFGKELGTVKRELARWSGGRAALLWAFGALTVLASIVIAAVR